MMSHHVHDLTIQGGHDDEITSQWVQMGKISEDLVNDINVGEQRLNPAAKPYSTPFDSALPKA